MAKKRLSKKQKGVALMVTFGLMAIIAMAATSYIDRSTQAVRLAKHNLKEVQTTQLCDAGVQDVLLGLWQPFKNDQNFSTLDTNLTGSTTAAPTYAKSADLPTVGKYAAGVVGYSIPVGDPYGRLITVRSVGWLDKNGNAIADADEPRKTVDVVCEFRLARSKVFDYTYFINNFGWMEGFSPTNLIVNGDMRSNGDFKFISGSGTMNGSVIAANNERLIPGAPGLISDAPSKWSDATYLTNYNAAGTAYKERMRQPYDPAKHGAVGSAEFENWRDLVFFSEAQIANNRIFGAVMEDSTGSNAWVNTTGTATKTLLDGRPTDQVVMPDLRDFGNVTDTADLNGKRFARSKAYTDDKATFGDGTVNPNYSGNAGSQSEFNPDGTPNVNYKGAYVDVWNSSTGSYQRISSNGIVNGTALLIGTSDKPIRIHGPVAFNGDAAIAGFVQGQGTLYTKRNIHIIGSIKYKNPPDFRGSNMQSVENSVEKKDFLGLAASESVIMGNTTTFGETYPLKYMTPPFTKPRLDDNGNVIPAFNANQVDGWGMKRYQCLLEGNAATLNAYKNAAAGGVNQIDAILYTNFVGGGNVGTAGGGMTLNGTIISRDEAIVAWSLPIRMNYDNRIRERKPTGQPLIDLDLPRSPSILRQTWQDRGFVAN